MNKSLFEEIEQTNATRTRPFSLGPGGCRAAMMRRNYYALETSSIKESFDSDVFSLYDDHKYDAVEKPKSHFTFNALSIDEQYLNADDPQLPPAEMKRISITSSKDQSSEREDSFDSVIGNFKSFEENPIITNDYNKISDMLKKYRESNEERLLCHRNSIEQLRQVQSKVKEIDDLDYNVNSLIFRAVEVHTDLLVMDTTVTRLLAETRQLVEELEDVKFLDDLIDLLNQDIGPVIHREWKYTMTKCDGPVEEGVAIT